MQLDIDELNSEFFSTIEIYSIEGNWVNGIFEEGSEITRNIENIGVFPLNGKELKFSVEGATVDNTIKFYSKNKYPILDSENTNNAQSRCIYNNRTFRIFARSIFSTEGESYYKYFAIERRIVTD